MFLVSCSESWSIQSVTILRFDQVYVLKAKLCSSWLKMLMTKFFFTKRNSLAFQQSKISKVKDNKEWSQEGERAFIATHFSPIPRLHRGL